MKLLLLFIFTTCTIFARDPITEQERQQRLKMFEYESVISIESRDLLRKKKKYSSYEMKLKILDPVNSKERTLTFQYFDPSNATKLKPILMIFPPIFWSYTAGARYCSLLLFHWIFISNRSFK